MTLETSAPPFINVTVAARQIADEITVLTDAMSDPVGNKQLSIVRKIVANDNLNQSQRVSLADQLMFLYEEKRKLSKKELDAVQAMRYANIANSLRLSVEQVRALINDAERTLKPGLLPEQTPIEPLLYQM